MNIEKGTLIRSYSETTRDYLYGLYEGSYDNKTAIIKSSGWTYSLPEDSIEPIAIVELPEKVQIGSECRFWDYDRPDETFISILDDVTSKGRFIDTNSYAWDRCEPVQKKKVVRDAWKNVRWCENNNWSIRAHEGTWNNLYQWPYVLHLEMLAMAGKEPDPKYNWHDCWLKELTK